MDLMRKWSPLVRRWNCWPSRIKTECTNNSLVSHRTSYSRYTLKRNSTIYTNALNSNKLLGNEMLNGYAHQISRCFHRRSPTPKVLLQSNFETVLVVGSILGVVKALMTPEEEIKRISGDIGFSDNKLNNMDNIIEENFGDEDNNDDNFDEEDNTEDDNDNNDDTNKDKKDNNYMSNNNKTEECEGGDISEDKKDCNESNIEQISVTSECNTKMSPIEQKDATSYLVSGKIESIPNEIIHQIINYLLIFLKVIPESISDHKKKKRRCYTNKKNKKVSKRRRRRLREYRERNKKPI